MKSYIFLVFSALLLFSVYSTVGQDNGFNFDGVDDYFFVPGASSLISNSAMSMSCWIYPANPNPGYPDFDGFLGFRNDVNADFYLLQLTSNTVEARFRNSSGTNYDIVQGGLVLNRWQHFVLTYDGSELKVYLNGVVGDSIAATGNITNTALEFVMGKLDFSAVDFYFDGSIDEVGLWSKSLTAAEVACIFERGINPTDPALQLYYDFNEGVAGGSNAGLTTVSDRMGNIDGQLTGAALTGNSSNWTNGVSGPNHTQVTTEICSGDSLLFGSQTLKDAGLYYNIIQVAGACDSIVALTLLVNDTVFGTDTRTECSPFTWIDGNTYTTNNNTAQHTLVGGSSAGCDSVVTLDLTILNVATATDVITACGSYTWTDGNTYTSSNNSATDTLIGGAANGCDSVVTLDLTILNVATATDVITACGSYTWIDGNTYTSSNNSATDTLIGGAANGCDSVVTLNLTITTIDTSLSQSSTILTSNASGAMHQWLDCNDNMNPISGATNQNYTVIATGSYAVELTKNNCTDTSACADVTVAGTKGLEFAREINLYPNPATKEVFIRSEQSSGIVQLSITNSLGQQIVSRIERIDFGKIIRLDIRNFSTGMYFVSLNDGKKTITKKLVVLD